MKPYKRVFNKLYGKSVDKIPNLSIIMTFASRYIGVPYKHFITDYRYLVEGHIKCCENFGIDMVSVISDPCREGADMGAEIIMPKNGVPSYKGVLIENYSDLYKLSVINPLKGERMLDRIKGVELFKEKVGHKYPILGWVEGAFASASNLRGINNFMTDLIENPEFVHELLAICTNQAIWFAKEQINSGADIIGIGDAAASLIGPHHYKEFVLPYEKEICEYVQEYKVKTKLHICGDISAFINHIPETGADIVDIDWMVDFLKAANVLKDKCSVCGNFDPVDILLQGTQKEVKEAVKKCVDFGLNDTFIAPGCEVPEDTPHENLLEISKTLNEIKG